MGKRRLGGIGSKLAAFLGAVSLLGSGAGAWGPQGHRQVGAIADAILAHHANARSHVQQLLGVSLAVAAPWADCAKSVSGIPGHPAYHPFPPTEEFCRPFETKAGKAEMIDYARRNWSNCTAPPHSEPCHMQYHFADIPLDDTAYVLHEVGAPDQNITEAIKAAIMVLEGKTPPPPFHFKNPREALLVLAHLVGDVHQPLHVGAVYLSDPGARLNPPDDTDSNSPTFTRGGNFIFVSAMTAKKPKQLHSEWDSISDVDTSGMVEEAGAVTPMTGDVETWPAIWTTETLGRAVAAYSNMSFGPHAKKGWPASFHDRKTYRTDEASLKRTQLESAGARLAQILYTIWPDA
jgi:hypothetical protein